MKKFGSQALYLRALPAYLPAGFACIGIRRERYNRGGKRRPALEKGAERHSFRRAVYGKLCKNGGGRL